MSAKSALKSFLKSDGFRKVLCWLGAQYIRLVYLSGRWKVVNGELVQSLWQEDKPFILAFWHGRILMMPYCWNRKKKIKMLISQHRDGQLIANTVKHFGIETISGSTSKGGAQALRSMLKTLKGGQYVGITPDGPRGPRMRASVGVVSVAKMSGVPVIPCAFGIEDRKHLKSWDRFAMAKFFSKGVFVWGNPIEIERKADEAQMETARVHIETELTRVTDEADRLTDHAPIEPAAPAEVTEAD